MNRPFRFCSMLVNLVCAVVLVGGADTSESAGDWQSIADFSERNLAAWAEFKQQKATRHPWNSSMPLPTSLAEAGLEAPIDFPPALPRMRDGGSTACWVKDPQGRYLAFAIAPALPVGRSIHEFNPRPTFYVGASWWKEAGAVRVPFDSPCELFLISLFGDDWKRIETDYYRELRERMNRLREAKAEVETTIDGLQAAITEYESRKAEAEPGATDNPDDAQRIREDH